MEELIQENDFYWYKKSLEVERKETLEHSGEPEKYPCKVSTEIWNSEDSATARHSFLYEQETICCKCGHTTLQWPEIGDFAE